MQLDPQEYLKKLVEVYQNQCNQYLAERIMLQAQLDLTIQKIEELERKITDLESEDLLLGDNSSNKSESDIDVDTNTDS
jgi:hypothetical protein